MPPNNLHKYTVLLITKVCHFKKIYVCPPPPPPQSVKKNYVCPSPQSVIASYGPAYRICVKSFFNLAMPINWTSPYPFEGLLVLFFIFFQILYNRKFCKQTVETLDQMPRFWGLIWVCTICIFPTKRTLGLNGLALSTPCFYVFC